MAIEITLRRNLTRLLTDGEVDDNFVALSTAIQGVLDGRGKPEGYASLDTDGRLPPDQTPSVQTLPTTAHDLNSYQTPGSYRQASTAGAQAGTNYPQATGGILSVEGTGVSGQTVQRYTVASTGAVSPTAGPRQYWRFSINTAWSPWQEVVSASVVGMAGGVASLASSGRIPAEQAPNAILLPTTAHSLDNYRTAGVYGQNATAGAVAGGASYPAPFAGLLEVHAAEGVPAANLLWQEYTVYGVEGGSPTGSGGRRYWRSCSNKTSGAWGPWREVARTSEVMTHTFLTAATDANTLTADNTWWSWTASAALGANFPSFSSNWAAAGYMRVVYGASTQVTQELTYIITGQKPRTFSRFGNTANNTWQTWKSTSSWSTATGLPTIDMGDIYVDGQGWYRWSGTAYSLVDPLFDSTKARAVFQRGPGSGSWTTTVPQFFIDACAGGGGGGGGAGFVGELFRLNGAGGGAGEPMLGELITAPVGTVVSWTVGSGGTGGNGGSVSGAGVNGNGGGATVITINTSPVRTITLNAGNGGLGGASGGPALGGGGYPAGSGAFGGGTPTQSTWPQSGAGASSPFGGGGGGVSSLGGPLNGLPGGGYGSGGGGGACPSGAGQTGGRGGDGRGGFLKIYW